MASQETVFGDMGGGKQTAGAAIPDIGSVTDNEVAPPEFVEPTSDGEPISPRLAATRYGAAAGQGYGGNGDPGSPQMKVTVPRPRARDGPGGEEHSQCP